MKTQLSNDVITPNSASRVGITGALIGLFFSSLTVFPLEYIAEMTFSKGLLPYLLTPITSASGAILGYLVLKAGYDSSLIIRSISIIFSFLIFVLAVLLGLFLSLVALLW